MRSAIFVDAGYLYAQGSKTLSSEGLRRVDVQLDLLQTIQKLRQTAATKSQDAPLLRIYWYDGLLRGELSSDQNHLANTDDVKLRLGIVNLAGQQKGVDSLIVTDLVELARNHAITDAILLSGDEDLRIGVQIAQSFGVRVHLIGIEPTRGSQSVSLLQEADTTTEWTEADIRTFLTIRPGSDGSAPSQPVSDMADTLKVAIANFVSSLNSEEMSSISELQENAMIPREFDRRLLAICGRAAGRDLDSNEKAVMRRKLRELVGERLDNKP
jgi:uncharacterized LabA/DUF88 family protein